MAQETQTNQQMSPPIPPQNVGLPPKKKGKKWLWILIAILVVGGIAGAASTAGKKKTESSTTEGTATTSSGPVEVAIGQPATLGNLLITVHSFAGSPGDAYFKPDAGKQFIVVDLEIENTGDKAELVSTMMEMSIRTPEGLKYDQAFYFPDPKYPDGDIQPHSKARGLVAFDVPSVIGPMDFVFAPGFGTPANFKLQ